MWVYLSWCCSLELLQGWQIYLLLQLHCWYLFEGDVGEWVRYLAAERTRTVTGILDLDSTWLAAKKNLYFFKNKRQDKGSGKISRIRLVLAQCQKIIANTCLSYLGKINTSNKHWQLSVYCHFTVLYSVCANSTNYFQLSRLKGRACDAVSVSHSQFTLIKCVNWYLLTISSHLQNKKVFFKTNLPLFSR